MCVHTRVGAYLCTHCMYIPTIQWSAVSCIHLVFLKGKIATKLMQNSSEFSNFSLVYESCLAKFSLSKQVLQQDWQ